MKSEHRSHGSYGPYSTHDQSPEPSGFIPAHGGYRNLLSFQKAEIIYDLTHRFCERFLRRGDRTIDQMVQAARSGKQNILEGSQASGTSKETEIKTRPLQPVIGTGLSQPFRMKSIMQRDWLRRPFELGFATISACHKNDIQNSRSASGSFFNKPLNSECIADSINLRGNIRDAGSTALMSSARPGV